MKLTKIKTQTTVLRNLSQKLQEVFKEKKNAFNLCQVGFGGLNKVILKTITTQLKFNRHLFQQTLLCRRSQILAVPA